MANQVLWDAAANTRGNVLSTELNSLADGSRTNAGTAVNNDSNLDTYGALELNVDFALAPDADAVCLIYLIQSLDGTNYADGSSTVDPGVDAHLLTIKILDTANAQRKMTKPFMIPPAKIKFILENQTGQAFPASGSTLELFTWNEEIQ